VSNRQFPPFTARGHENVQSECVSHVRDVFSVSAKNKIMQCAIYFEMLWTAGLNRITVVS
jgi:hypothetical protein